MARIKEHPVTQILNLIEALSTDEKRIIFDKVRPAPKPRQKGKGGKSAQKRKAATAATDGNTDQRPFAGLVCAACDKPFGDGVHHLESRPTYHPFQSVDEAKAATAQKRRAGKGSDSNQPLAEQRCAACQEPFGVNAHHMKSDVHYHEFVEAGEAKGAGG